MPAQYVITGTITPADGAARAGIKVQAFDRDMPSIERRTGTLQRLGEASTDAEGRFQITYTLEQFQSGEGISTFRRTRDKNADLSFRVFDRNEQELSVTRIEALDRVYRPDQIIFNVPTPVNVTIFLEPQRESPALSEYEQLLAQVAPVIQGVPLPELSDDDIAFLGNELGLDQQRDVQQRVEWLRRSSILARDTGVPPEAFYGWGRKDVPAQFSELAGTPVKDLPQVLDKLSSLPEETLTAALQAAVEARIVPTALRDRAKSLAAAVRRRVQQQYALRLRLESAQSGGALPGYLVTSFDAQANREADTDLGTDVTDSLGEFVVPYFAEESARGSERNFRFRVRGPGIADPIEVTTPLKPGAEEPVAIRIPLPGTQPTLRQLAGDGHADVGDAVLSMLEQKYGIRSLVDIRRVGGLSRIADLRAHDSASAARLDALADLNRLSDNLTETTALLTHHYDSVLTIADASRQEFVSSMSTNEAPLSAARAVELHIAAKAQTDILDQMFYGIALDFASGIRPSSGFATGDYFPPFPHEKEND